MLAICAVVTVSSAGVASAAGGLNCAPGVWVIGARGSGETKPGDPGNTVGPFTEKLRKIAGGGVVGGEGLDYPAIPVIDWKLVAFRVGGKAWEYKRSVDKGVDRLVRAVKERAGTCKRQKIVLSGYSQGAQVVRTALFRLEEVESHIGAVVLFGDPEFDPDSRAARGNFSEKRHGVLGLPGGDFPNVFENVVTYCRIGDLICQGFPNLTTAHGLYHPGETVSAAVRVADWLDLFQPPACTPASSVLAIIDDSGSMTENDPAAIRRAALELLITKPSWQQKELGAVEFGTDAAALFPPAIVSGSAPGMLGALNFLANDGASDGGGTTNYNAAFVTGTALQPQAQARIFLTDGKHNEGGYENVHGGAPRTYVIGLDIGPAGQGSEEADLLGRIAAETQGGYFPLLLAAGDSTTTQLSRLQPAINEIDAALSCQKLQEQEQQTFSAPSQPGPPVATEFRRQSALQIVASWSTPGVDLDLVAAAARNPDGKIVATLTGRGRIKGTKRGRGKLVVNRVEGATFETVTVQRPKGGKSLVVRFAAATLPAPVEANVQVLTVPPGTPAGTTAVGTQPLGGTPTGGGTGSSPGAGSAPGGGSPSPPPRRVIVVDNRVTNGAGMREDSTPARLTTQPWTFCGSRGCNINGTERSTGGSYDAAVCQTGGERTTNGNDHDASDDGNPERFESTRYYGVRLGDGTFGYVSEVWIRASDRGGLGLPGC